MELRGRYRYDRGAYGENAMLLGIVGSHGYMGCTGLGSETDFVVEIDWAVCVADMFTPLKIFRGVNFVSSCRRVIGGERV